MTDTKPTLHATATGEFAHAIKGPAQPDLSVSTEAPPRLLGGQVSMRRRLNPVAIEVLAIAERANAEVIYACLNPLIIKVTLPTGIVILYSDDEFQLDRYQGPHDLMSDVLLTPARVTSEGAKELAEVMDLSTETPATQTSATSPLIAVLVHHLIVNRAPYAGFIPNI